MSGIILVPGHGFIEDGRFYAEEGPGAGMPYAPIVIPLVARKEDADVLCAADDRNQWSAARCSACDGRGFTRSGDLYGRSFPVCNACAGVGQTYLAPVGGK